MYAPYIDVVYSLYGNYHSLCLLHIVVPPGSLPRSRSFTALKNKVVLEVVVADTHVALLAEDGRICRICFSEEQPPASHLATGRDKRFIVLFVAHSLSIFSLVLACPAVLYVHHTHTHTLVTHIPVTPSVLL